MGIGSCTDVVVKRWRSLSHLLMSCCCKCVKYGLMIFLKVSISCSIMIQFKRIIPNTGRWCSDTVDIHITSYILFRHMARRSVDLTWHKCDSCVTRRHKTYFAAVLIFYSLSRLDFFNSYWLRRVNWLTFHILRLFGFIYLQSRVARSIVDVDVEVFAIILRSDYQYCLEIKKFSVLDSSKLFWFIGHFPNVRWQLVPQSTGSAGHRKTAPTEFVSIGALHV